MSVWAIMRVKDEADIIAPIVAHTLTQVDHVLVADNGSTDGTVEILEGLPVELIHDPEVGYYQSRAMSALAARAADDGATWVIPVDADEAWTVNAAHGDLRVGDVLDEMPDDVAVVSSVMLNHVSTSADPDDDNPLTRMGWRFVETGAMYKVACRPCVRVVIAQGNHAAHYPTLERPHPSFEIAHYPYRSAEQTIRKARNGAAAYAAATDLPDCMGEHWRKHGAFTDEQLEGVFRDWWHFEQPELNPALMYDPLPAKTGVP